MASTAVLRGSEETQNLDPANPSLAVLSAGGAGQALAIIATYDPTQLPPAFLDTIRLLEKTNVISLVDGLTYAELEMQLEDGHIVFNILLPKVNACGLNRVYHVIQPTDSAETVRGTLSAGSRFFWHLRRGHYHPFVDSVKVEFLEITASENEFDDAGYPIVIPSEENLLRNGAIDLYVSSDEENLKRYGIRLTNNSKWDLFPAAFYFNHSDWSIGAFRMSPSSIFTHNELWLGSKIDTYYHSGTAGQFEAEAPLQKEGGTLTIGFGDGGSDPISFRLDKDDQDLDVGHMKIFFSTKPVDLRHMEQESPFTGNRSTFRVQNAALDTWVAIEYPIIQRRAL